MAIAIALLELKSNTMATLKESYELEKTGSQVIAQAPFGHIKNRYSAARIALPFCASKKHSGEMSSTEYVISVLLRANRVLLFSYDHSSWLLANLYSPDNRELKAAPAWGCRPKNGRTGAHQRGASY
jgi:hypothetical protein